jgi:hypothetical protein
MSQQHLDEFLRSQLVKFREARDSFLKSKGISIIDAMNKKLDLPVEFFVANAYMNAFVIVSNFLATPNTEVNDTMVDAEALATATELFLAEANKEAFTWPKEVMTRDAAGEAMDEKWDADNFAKGLNALIYYWYYFQRPVIGLVDQPQPEHK